MEELIPLEQHKKVCDELRESFEANLEEGFNEAFTMIKEAQSEIKFEREKSEIFETIAKLEKVIGFECVQPLQSKVRELILSLYQCVGRARKIDPYEDLEDDLRPEYDLSKLKRTNRKLCCPIKEVGCGEKERIDV